MRYYCKETAASQLFISDNMYLIDFKEISIYQKTVIVKKM